MCYPFSETLIMIPCFFNISCSDKVLEVEKLVLSQSMEEINDFLFLNFYKTKMIARIQNCILNLFHSQAQHWLHLMTQPRSSLQDFHASYSINSSPTNVLQLRCSPRKRTQTIVLKNR